MKRMCFILVQLFLFSNLSFGQNDKDLIFYEHFDNLYDLSISPLNNSKVKMGGSDESSYCTVLLGDNDIEKFRNAGIFKEFLAFPKHTYVIEAELFIPAEANFGAYPSIVMFDSNWRIIGKDKNIRTPKQNTWNKIKASVNYDGNEIAKVRVAIHSQLLSQNNWENEMFYIRKFDVYEIDKTEQDMLLVNKPLNIVYWDSIDNINKIITLKYLNAIALNCEYYVGGFDDLSAKSINRYLHKTNRSIKALAYFNAESLYKNSSLMNYIKIHHPDWIIKDKNGNYIEEAGYPGNQIMDITNRDYTEWIGDIISRKCKFNDFDGVFLDMISAYLYPGYYTSSDLISEKNGQINSDMWFRASQEFVKMLKNKNVNIVFLNGIGLNSGDQYLGCKEAITTLVNEADGALIEDYGFAGKDNTCVIKNSSSLLNDIRMLNVISKNNKVIWVSSRAIRDNNTSEEIKKLFLAYYLLGKGNSCFLSLNYGSLSKGLEYNAIINNLGISKTEYSINTGNKFRREFENGHIDVQDNTYNIELNKKCHLSK